MGYICAICSESIENFPGGLSDEQKPASSTTSKLCNLSSAPCGHLFHKYCINKWMNSSISSSNCPNCRKTIPLGSCLDLYPDSYDDIHSNPNSPECQFNKVKCELHEKEISSLKSKLHTVEADFKIQLSLYELLASDHQKRNVQFHEESRKKEAELATFKADAASIKHQLEMEVQKLKLDLEIANHKFEGEKNGRLAEMTMHSDFFQRLASQLQAQHVEVLSYALSFQRDSPSIIKSDEPRPGTSRFVKPLKSRASTFFSKPRRGKKMVYEKGPDEIEQVDLEESDEDDIDIMAGPDTRKRKMMSIRSLASLTGNTTETPKTKIKRLISTELSLSPITLTLSSDTEDERDQQQQQQLPPSSSLDIAVPNNGINIIRLTTAPDASMDTNES